MKHFSLKSSQVLTKEVTYPPSGIFVPENKQTNKQTKTVKHSYCNCNFLALGYFLFVAEIAQGASPRGRKSTRF